MNLYNDFKTEIAKVLRDMAAAGTVPGGLDPARAPDSSKWGVEPPRDPSHGDLSTNAALVLSKDAGLKPRDFAQHLAEGLAKLPDVTEATVAGPGFVNLRLKDDVWREQLRGVLTAGTAYGDSQAGKGEKVNVEYVSANPTGPMHVGHGRGAVFGDALARLLEKAGFDVTREYYINDAGTQINMLAHSVYWRYLEALKRRGIQSDVIPGTLAWITEGAYPGDYLIPVGEKLADIRGESLLDVPASEWREVCANFGCIEMMTLIRQDLEILGIKHDEFFSERLLHHNAKSGALLREYFLAIGSNPDKYFADPDLSEKSRIELAFEDLKGKDLIYEGKLEPPKGKLPDDWEPREQTLFKATQFGDDVDRPLKKSAGSWTYFASDIAYHYDKFKRGFGSMIDVWGADHGGYIKRMQAAVTAITDKRASLDVKICQLVNLTENGQPVKMSKRAGTFVTLREVVDRVGKDVVRFIMLTRKNDAALDFDLAKALEQSKDNPVFYVQYAHARAHSVFRNAVEEFPGLATDAGTLRDAKLERLTDKDELALIKLMATWPRMVESAAEAHEPHRIAFYLGELAAAFHGLWNKGNTDASARFIVKGDAELTRARLALLRAVATVIASGLAVLGVTPVEEMR